MQLTSAYVFTSDIIFVAFYNTIHIFQISEEVKYPTKAVFNFRNI